MSAAPQLYVPEESKALAFDVSQLADLLVFPWKYDSGSIESIKADNVLQYIPHEAPGVTDRLFLFFNEAWRVLQKDGKYNGLVPHVHSVMAFLDPTAKRFFMGESFLCLNAKWREANKFPHDVKCNFEVNCDPIVPTDLTTLHPEAAQRQMRHYTNTIMQWNVRLNKLAAEERK